jgi:polyisoprenoid-binding protein YceI
MKQHQFKIDPTQSHIDWTGRKVTGAHNGTIAIKEGTLTVADGQLTGGHVIVETTSIIVLDVTDPATNAQFAGHLASDDFFGSAQYPEARLDITAVNNQHIEGKLTMKGITHPIAFEANIHLSGDTLTAQGKLVINRTLYGIKYRSGNFFQNLGDTLIYNDFDLVIHITARAAVEVALA